MSLDNFKKNLSILSYDIGSRYVGSKGENKAQKLIYDYFKKYGNVEIQKFPIDLWNFKKSELKVNNKIYEATALGYSPSGEIKAEVVYCGGATEKEIKNEDLAGKIALVSKSWENYPTHLHRTEKYENVSKSGALAFIMMQDSQLAPASSGIIKKRKLGKIPAISVDKKQGKILKKTKYAKISIKTYIKNSESKNIILKLGEGKRKIIIGAHYDSWFNTQGAIDNASGISILLELSKLLSQINLESEIWLVAFSGEELGLWGSKYFADSYQDIDLMINIDGVGSKYSKLQISCSSVIQKKVKKEIEKQKLSANTNLETNSHSDHWPFQKKGIKTLFITNQQHIYNHTKKDDIKIIDFDQLEKITQFVYNFVIQMK